MISSNGSLPRDILVSRYLLTVAEPSHDQLGRPPEGIGTRMQSVHESGAQAVQSNADGGECCWVSTSTRCHFLYSFNDKGSSRAPHAAGTRCDITRLETVHVILVLMLRSGRSTTNVAESEGTGRSSDSLGVASPSLCYCNLCFRPQHISEHPTAIDV